MPPSISAPVDSLDGNTNPAAAKFCSEFHVPGQTIPLDFTLKTGMRVVSSSSVNIIVLVRLRATDLSYNSLMRA